MEYQAELLNMSAERNLTCNSLSRVFALQWANDVPSFPQCAYYLLPVLVYIYCFLVCIPHIAKLVLKKSHRRPVNALFITECTFLSLLLLNNVIQFGFIFHYSGFGLTVLFYTPVAFIITTVIYLCVLNVERLRNAKNSGVAFFLVLIFSSVAAILCWNHLVDRLYPHKTPTYDNASYSLPSLPSSPDLRIDGPFVNCLLQITDAVNLIGGIMLLLSTCFSEKMIEYKKLFIDRRRKSRFLVLKRLLTKVHSQSLESSALEPTKTEDGNDTYGEIPSPEEYASYMSRVVYAWFLSLIIRGYRKPLELKDLWRLDKQHCAETISKKFVCNVDRFVVPKKKFNHYMEKRRISLISATIKGGNDNFNHEPSADHLPTQCALGGRGHVDNHQVHRSIPVESKSVKVNQDRRSNESIALETCLNTGSMSRNGRFSDIEHFVLSGHDTTSSLANAENPGAASSLDCKGSNLDNGGIPPNDAALRMKEKMRIDSASQLNSTGTHTSQPLEIYGLQKRPSCRRSIRTMTEDEAVCESRNDSVLAQPFDERVSCILSTGEKQEPPYNAQDKKVLKPDEALQTGANAGESKVDIIGGKNRHPHSGSSSTYFACFSRCRKPSTRFGLLHALAVTFWKSLLWSAVLKLFYDILVFVNPSLLKLLLAFLQSGAEEPIWHGYVYAVLMLLVTCLQSLILQRYFRTVNILGMHVRTAITCAVYRKSLRLSNMARRESTTGQIMNLISSDAQHFVQLMPFLNIIWSGPFQIIVAVVFLWNELGPSVLAGIGVLLLLLPMNVVVARVSKSFQEKKFHMADSRIKTISEILSGIRVIKLYAWEPSFIREVTNLRNKEIDYLRRFTFCQSISFLWACAPFLVALSTFGVYITISEENILDAQKAFVSLTLFNILRFPLFMFPMVTSNLVQVFVSLRRLNTYLEHTELDPNSFTREDTPGIAAVIERGVFGWDPEEEPVLKNISLQFPEGQLTSVMGTVGCGKSSLLHALLGDMEVLNGRVNIKGTVAYVPQQPWIFNATLRDNILFSQPYDPERYDRVIRACGLKPDLLTLPKGDLTEIGDKGVNLSGGQKQRVSLARACYADADLYLLDDPLSAVDAHVGVHILNHVLSRTSGLLASKTCILTTHSSNALPFSDRVALLVDGQLSELGNYRQLLQSRTSRLSEFLADAILSNRNESLDGGEKGCSADSNNNQNDYQLVRDGQFFGLNAEVKDSSNAHSEQCLGALGELWRSNSKRSCKSDSHRSEHQLFNPNRTRTVSTSSEMVPGNEGPALFDSISSLENGEYNQNAAEDSKAENAIVHSDQLTQPEKANVGRVKWRVFKIYLRKLGLFYCLLILILYPVTNLAQFGTSLWLADWSNDAKLQANVTKIIRDHSSIIYNLTTYPELLENVEEIRNQRNYRLIVYAVLGFIQVSTSLASILVFYLGHLVCAKKLHGLLLDGILHAPAVFFDTVPAGRIINRFSQDVATVDVPLVSSMRSALMCLIQCFLTLCMACAVNPWSFIPILCLTILYLLLQTIYVANSRQLKRIESVSRSPIFSHFSETLTGVECIRAFGLTDRYACINFNRLDVNNSAVYAGIMAQRWLAVLLESVGNMVILFVAIFSVSARGQLSAGFSGLVISYALNLNQTLNWLVRMTAELENDIVCVERIDEYSRIEQEAKWEIPESKPPDSWPQGKIEFLDYGTRYRPQLAFVLKSITVKINCGERVGIIGRTGSGKSSLVMGLFRMLEAAEGQIKIDDVDIASLGLHDLRQRLTLIPQDPVLFSGTLRFNLDPFNKHTDEEVWTALELAHLKTYVEESSNGLGLDMVIAESGSNMSMGQRQLVCLARALLRHTSILVLDEATAAVDPLTDSLIQCTIRNEFKRCTVLTIAHRLNTILDYDRVILLQDGRIAEIGNPRELLKDQGCKFYSLAQDAHLVE